MKVVTFGEIMLRLSPPSFKRISQTNSFELYYGGSEANVSVSLANYGLETIFVTKVPDNEIGKSAINKLNQYGVDTSHILKGGERLGTYYLEKGASQRPSKVIYDRKYSSISTALPDEFNWDEIFFDAEWYHVSGITPALSEETFDNTLKSVQKAKEKGLTVSCDLNYRAKLWTQESANTHMEQIMKYVDVLIANEEDIEKVFSIKADNTDVEKGELDYDSYQKVAREVLKKYDCKLVACTLRTSISASRNKWKSLIFDGQKVIQSREYDVTVIDRVGAGDSFSAGLIYGLLNDYSIKDTLEFATAASCLKHTIEGDFNMLSVEEVESLVNGNASGRVQR